MYNLKKVTRNDINKDNMVAIGYCQCQTILNLFGENYKVGYNSGIYGWNYDLYKIGEVDVITGYNTPFREYSNKELKSKLIELENKIRKEERGLMFSEYEKNIEKWKKEFLGIFE